MALAADTSVMESIKKRMIAIKMEMIGAGEREKLNIEKQQEITEKLAKVNLI